MKIEFTLTLQIYKSAYALFQRRQLFMRLMTPICVGLLTLGILIALLIKPDGAYGWLIIPSRFAIGGGFVGAILLPLARIYAIRKSYCYFLPASANTKTMSFDVDDRRIFSDIPGVGSGSIQWSAIYDFAQDEQITLLYLTKRRFYFFPTTAMSSEQRDELQNLVAHHLVKR